MKGKFKMIKKVCASIVSLLAACAAWAGDLAVSAYWQDHMVLQRNNPITVWGKDAAGRTVTVSFAGQTANAVTESDGFWETTFAQPFAVSATPRALTITDNAGESLTLSDILVGDVFLAAGQSNMDRRLVHDHTYEEPQAVKDFCQDDDGIRFIRIARSSENTNGQENLFDLPPHKAVNDAIKYFGQGYDWAPAVDTNKNFVSSLALNFAHYIRQTNAAKGQDVPIGIIHASSGGTAIRSWLRPEVLTANGFTALSTDGGYWNNMMAPIKRAKFRAILWYQGCSDAGKTPDEYKQLMDVLVKDRRDRWGDNGDLPFYAVQIGTIGYDNGEVQTIGFDKYPAPSMSNNGQNYAFIREAQRLWDVSDTGTHGLAVILDHVRCMDKGDLHPVDKNFVARRLSLFARRDLYGEPNLTTDGPVFSRAVREADGAVRISFKPGTAKGLTSGRLKMANDLTLSRFIKMDGPVKGFAICGSDGVWKEAEATIEGETVVLRAQGLSAPTRFHYGFWSITRSDNFEFGQRLSLYNGEGLPLSPLAPMDVEVASTSAKTADPVFLPGSGLFNPTTNVTLSCATAGATIRYTTNGSEPTASSPAYTAPIAISATTTIKARAFVANKEASDVMVATYTRGTPAAPTVDPMWSVCPYDAAAWTPLANNILAGKNGTTAGGLAWGNISKDTANLTDGTVPVTPDGSKLVGFCDNSSITYTFAEPQTITELRLSTRIDGSTGDLATRLKYAGLHIQDVYVKKSGSSSWEALGTPVYQHTSLEETGGMMFALADDGIGHLAENVVGLKIDFLKGEVVWSQVAEIEASGYATDFEPVTPAAGSLVVDTTVSDHCVLQRGVANKVKGTATAGATVTVTFGGVTASAVANANGEYVVSFNPGAANATGRNLVVSDSVNTVTIADVLVGDVFYLSGQSNVRFEVEAYNKSEALADCDYPNFRMMVMPSENSGRIVESDKDLPCSWIVSSSTTCTAMSSFGFFLGRELIKSKNVPIGIVSAAVKGTDIASWLPNGGCDKYMACRCDHIAVKGAIWYQGESDALGYSNRTYPQKLKNLIQYWRTNRGNSNLPVVVVQLPRYRDTYRNCGDTEKINCWGLFRVDQDLAITEVDNAVCVPTHDYGAEYNIHPSDKHLMGARIALAVRNLMYGDDVAYRCPYPTSAVKSADGSSVTVSFPSSTVLSFSSDTASESFGAEEDMFNVGNTKVLPTISADGHSLVFSGSFTSATSVDYALCGFPQILVRDANGFPMPPFSLALTTGEGAGGEEGTVESYAITVTPPQNGTLTTSPSGSVAAGTTITVTATPAQGYQLVSITVNGSVISGTTFTMPAGAVTVAATFEQESSSGGGEGGEGDVTTRLTWTTGVFALTEWAPLANNLIAGKKPAYSTSDVYPWNGAIACLTDAAISTTRDSGSSIGIKKNAVLTWTFDSAKTIEKIRVTALGENHLYKYDKINVSSVEVLVDGAWQTLGEGVVWNGPESYDSASSLFVTLAAANSAALATNVSGVRLTFGDPNGLTYCACGEIEVIEKTSGGGSETPEPTLYAITVTTPSNGTLTTSPSGSVAAGTTVTVTATAAEGYTLAAITVNGTAIDGNTFTMPAADVTLAATFEQKSSSGGEEGGEEGGEANPTWTTVSCAPSAWQPLANNLLLNVTGTSTAQGVPSYASTDLGVLTDGAVPTAAPDKAGIFGIRNNDTISWTFAEPKTLGQIRISSCYLTGAAYDGVHVSKVEVMKAGSSEWSELAGEVEYKGESAAGKINCAVLSSGSVPVAKNIVGLKVTFGTCETGYANYYAEIEASGTTGGNTPADPEPTLYAITVTTPENGTLVTSPSGSVAAGTTVTVTATAAEGYQLATITVNGTAITGDTFTMPAADVTLAATFEKRSTPPVDPPETPEPTQMFYIGETGYDSWVDAYGAAKNGDTITVGKDAVFAVSGTAKSITVNLCGRPLEWQSSGWAWDDLAVVDSVGTGALTLAVNNRNVGGLKLDMSSLTKDQLTGPGKFWVNASTEIKFPKGMTLAECTARIANPAEGMKIVVAGVTYTYQGGSWEGSGKSYPEWIDAASAVDTGKYDAWAEAKGVTDVTAAMEEAYLLNCANTTAAVEAAKAAFKITSITVNADDTAVIGLPEGDFNGTVSILGCETVNGEYHAKKAGDHFFKAVLTK